MYPQLPLPPPSPAFLSGLASFRSLAGVGGGTKEWVFFLALPLPWVPEAESFLVPSLEQGTKPSPAWPQSGHSWECVSVETGWCGGALLSPGVWLSGLCLCVSGYVCVSGLECFVVCLCLSLCLQMGAFKWVVGELRTDGMKMSVCVFLCVYENYVYICVTCTRGSHEARNVAQW